MKSRLRRWQAGDIQELWSDVLVVEDKLSKQWKKPNKAPPETLQRTNARRARSGVEEGHYRKAIQALCSEGLAPPSSAVLEEMLAKHPQVSPPQIPLDPAPLPADISEGDVLRALKSFPDGSAPGPSGCRANHLKEAVLCPSPDCAAFALRNLEGRATLHIHTANPAGQTALGRSPVRNTTHTHVHKCIHVEVKHSRPTKPYCAGRRSGTYNIHI